MRKTVTQLLNEKNAKAVQATRKAYAETAQLHRDVAAGKLTAAQALMSKMTKRK